MHNKYNARLIQRIHFSDLRNKAYHPNYQHVILNTKQQSPLLVFNTLCHQGLVCIFVNKTTTSIH